MLKTATVLTLVSCMGCASARRGLPSAFELAADPSAKYYLRREATWTLNREDASRLRILLGTRIVGRHDGRVFDDIGIYDIVVSEESLSELQRKWPIPDAKGKIDGHVPTTWELAANPNVDCFIRQKAAGALAPDGAAKLRHLLLLRIPGRHNLAALEDICVLSVVANKDTAIALQEKLSIPYDNGSINGAIQMLIVDIKNEQRNF
jgi:hypothetical protein